MSFSNMDHHARTEADREEFLDGLIEARQAAKYAAPADVDTDDLEPLTDDADDSKTYFRHANRKP